MNLGIEGRTAIITAASRGIGRATAFALAREGVNLVICARGEEELQKLAAEIRAETGVRVLAQRADVTVAADVDALLAQASATFGAVDILVVIGGSPPRGAFDEISETQLRDGFEMIVIPLFRLVLGVLPEMKKRKWGRIVTVQSRSVREPIPLLTVSNSTRPAAAGLIKSLSQEAAAEGVLFNTVLPGRILTDRFIQGAERSVLGKEEYIRAQTQELPTRRLGEAHEIADAISFLVSERASYINGVVLPVDGGLIRSI